MVSEMTKNAIVYVRVSTDEQVDGYSLNDQEDRCRKEAERQGFHVLHVYREEGISAKTLDRPQLEELLQYITKNHKNVQAIFFYHSSRLSRNTLDFLTLRAVFSKYGISLNSLTEPITGDSPETKFLSTILSAANQLDNEIKGRNVRNAMKRRFLEGDAIAKVPYGYKLVKTDKKSIVLRDDRWWDILSTLWHKVQAEHLTILQATRWLTKESGKQFRRSTLDNILRNKFYCGYMVSPTYGTKKGVHEAMISEDMYYAVRAIIEDRRLTKATVKKYNPDFAIKGLLTCFYCGHKATAAWSTGKHKAYGYYFCYTCDQRVNIPRDTVEDAYMAYLTSIKATPEAIQYFMELLDEEYSATYSTLKNTASWIDAELTKLKEALVKLETKHLEGVYTDEDYIRIRDGIKIKITAQTSLANEKKIDVVNIEDMKAKLTYYLSNFDKLFINADPETRYRIGCSINPKGFTFESGKVRTPELGYCYQAIQAYSAGSVQSSTPIRIRTGDLRLEKASS